MAFFTYIMASGKNGTLYAGSTDDLLARAAQHRNKTFGGFTAQYDVNRLVWFEGHDSREAAFRRERQIKKWNRVWKLELIEKANPGWRDLCDDIRLGGLADIKDWVPASAGMSGEREAVDEDQGLVGCCGFGCFCAIARLDLFAKPDLPSG